MDGQKERAVLATVLLPDTQADLSDPLAELAALTESAGLEVVDSILQKRTKMSSSYAMGKGKLQELAILVQEGQADVVVFDNELTPRQIRGIERKVECKVIDRSELILDIFAERASTREAQLQVELAQLQYTAPRIRGMWTHLERIAGAGGATAAGAVGGVGTRGPGERQIEIDRRIVRKRIGLLRREIEQIDRRKKREVQTRSDQFAVSLVGYTNSGKSTLLNRLTGAKQYVADQLFATLDTKTLRWEVSDHLIVLLSDTVGFVRDLPHHLVASFRATLEEVIHADLILHVVDLSSSNAWQQMEAVEKVLDGLGCADISRFNVLNKVDIADDTSMAELLTRHRAGCLCISAFTGVGIAELAEKVCDRARLGETTVTLKILHADGKLLSEVSRLATILDRRYGSDHVELDVRMDRRALEQLIGRCKSLEVIRMDTGELPPDDEGGYEGMAD